MAILMAVLTIWVTLPVIVGINTWWLKRGGRWDGQGDLFNLLVASWLVANMLGAGLVTLGIPPLATPTASAQYPCRFALKTHTILRLVGLNFLSVICYEVSARSIAVPVH